MKKKIRFFLSFFLSLSLTITPSIVYAEGVLPTPQNAGGGSGNPDSAEILYSSTADNCKLISQKKFLPVGDSRGSSILTKLEVVRECNITKSVQGKCLEWEETKESYALPNIYYNTYDSNNYEDSIGALLGMLGAYDQIEHLWSGWHGFCYIGTKVDFSWASNPWFWASLIMNTILQGSEQGKFLADTELGQTINSVRQGIGEQVGAWVQGVGSDAVNEAAQRASDQAIQQTYDNIVQNLNPGEAMTESQIQEIIAAGQAGLTQYYQQLGNCLMASGFNMATALYEFAQDDESGLKCDPVDEVCGDTEGDMYGEDIMTADEESFDAMMEEYRKQYADGKTDINIDDFVEEIKRENGVVTFKFRKVNEIPGIEQNLDQEKFEKIKEQMKLIKLGVSSTIEVLKVASCMGVAPVTYMSNSVDTPSSSDSDRMDVKQGISMAINWIGNKLGPYGPLISAALQVVLNVLTSFKDVDTCHDEDDAKEAGKRHERTNYALQFDLCHFVKKKCVDSSWTPSNFFGDRCILWGYHYCCYDQILTKILIEQLKAQLGRDWTHCTGITLSDLNKVSFSPCKDYQINSGYPDGAAEGEAFDPSRESYQKHYKCVDYTEFENYLANYIGNDIDETMFNQFFDDLSDQANGKQL